MKRIGQGKGIVCAQIIILDKKDLTCVSDNTHSIVSLNKQYYNSLHKHFNDKFTL